MEVALLRVKRRASRNAAKLYRTVQVIASGVDGTSLQELWYAGLTEMGVHEHAYYRKVM